MPSGKEQSPIWRFAPLLMIVAGLGTAYALGLHRYVSLDRLAESSDALSAWVAMHPVLAPLAFLLAYATAVAFAFPVASLLTVVGGLLFGWLAGGVMSVIGATVGATVLFLVARSAFGDVLTRRLKGRAARIAAGIDANAFGYVLALRLTPVFPFLMVTMAAALARVRTATFASATFVGILPATFAYAWLGEGVDSVIAAARAAGRETTLRDLLTPEISIAFALLALVAFIPPVLKSLRA